MRIVWDECPEGWTLECLERRWEAVCQSGDIKFQGLKEELCLCLRCVDLVHCVVWSESLCVCVTAPTIPRLRTRTQLHKPPASTLSLLPTMATWRNGSAFGFDRRRHQKVAGSSPAVVNFCRSELWIA